MVNDVVEIRSGLWVAEITFEGDDNIYRIEIKADSEEEATRIATTAVNIAINCLM